MRLEDLEDSIEQGRKPPTQEPFECGFNVDDSSSSGELAALPSIQNEYTLQIKSFYQYKKPYI